MTKTVKNLSLVLIFGTAVLSLLIFSLGVWFEKNGEEWVSSTVSEKTNVSISVGSTQASFFRGYNLKDVRIDEPFEFSADKITVRFAPWKLFNLNPALIDVELKNPLFRYSESKFSDPSDDIKLEKIINVIPILLFIRVSNGNIQFHNENKDININEMQGILASSLTDIYIELKSGGKGFDTLNTEIHISRRVLNKSSFLIKLGNFDVQNHYLKPYLKNYTGKLRGGVDLELKGFGNLINRPFKDLDWNLKLKDNSLTIRPYKNSKRLPVKFISVFNPKKIGGSLKIGPTIGLKGNIENPFGEWIADLHLEINKADVSDLVGLSNLKGPLRTIKGTVDLDLNFKGNQKKPSLIGTYNILADKGLIKVPQIRGKVFSTVEEITMKASLMGGDLHMVVPKNLENKRSYELRLDNLSLDSFGNMNGIPNIGGTFQSEISLKADLDPLDFRGKFFIKNLKWGRQEKPEILKGIVRYKNRTFTIKTNNNDIDVRARLIEEGVDLEKFYVTVGGSSEISAHGRYEKGKYGFSIQGKGIPPDTWPPLVKSYPSIEGSLNFDGTISGQEKDSDAKMKIVFNNLKFLDEGGTWNGSTDLLWSNNNFWLKQIEVDGGYRGEIERSIKKEKPLWKVNLTMDQAEPRLLFDVFKSTEDVSGRITGSIDLIYEGGQYVGLSTMVWDKGYIRNFSFDEMSFQSVMEPNLVRINDILVLKGAKALKGSIELTGLGPKWNYNGIFQSQQWGTQHLSVDGEFRLQGKIDTQNKLSEGKMSSPLVWINECQLEDTNLQFSVNDNNLSLSGKMNDTITLEMDMNHRKKRIKGRMSGQNLDLEEIFQKFLKPWGITEEVRGKFNTDIRFRGRITDPRIQINFQVSTGTWRNETFWSKASLHVKGSTISILSSKTKLEKGGSLYAKGNIYLSDDAILDVEGVGSDIYLDSLFHLLRWPVRWDGQTNVTFSVKGAKEDREFRVAFDGKHQGIGPFRYDGTIAGTAIGTKGNWNLDGIRVTSGEGHAQLIKGSQIFIDKSKKGKMRLVLDVRNLHAGVLTLFGRVELTGSWRGASEKYDGDAKPPKEIDVFARSLWINQFLLNGNVTHLSIKTGKLDFSPIEGSGQILTGHVNYENYPEIEVNNLRYVEYGEEKLFVEGFVGSPRWDFNMRAEDIDAHVVRALFDTTLPFSGPMDFQIKGTGNLSDPELSGNVIWKNGYYGRIPIDSAITKFKLNKGIIILSDLYARKKKGYLLEGSMKFGTNLTTQGQQQKTEVDVRVEKGDFHLAKDIWPSVSMAKGSFSGNLFIGPRNNKRTIEGKILGKGLKMRSSSYIPYAKKGNINIELKDDQLRVHQSRAKFNNGYIYLTGSIDFKEGLPAFYDLAARSSKKNGPSIRVPYLSIPPGPVLGRFSILKKKLAGASRGEPLFKLKMHGPSSKPRVSGTVKLENTIFTYPPLKDPNAKKEKLNVAQKWLIDLRNRIDWDVIMEAGKKTRYENSLVDARIMGSLHVEGPYKNIRVNGRVKSNQGAIVYSGNEFKVKDADIEILTEEEKLGEPSVDEIFVYIKVEAEKDIFYTDALGEGNQDTIIMTVDRSLLGEIQPRFRSKNNPNLSSQRALQLALGIPFTETLDDDSYFGQSTETSEEDFDKILRTGLVQLLDSSLATPLARAVARQTGLVDFIRVTYAEDELQEDEDLVSSDISVEGDEEEDQSDFLRVLKGTKVKMGRDLSGRLFADYSFRVDEYENELDFRHELELAYRVHRNFFIRAISELDSERTLGRPPDRRALLENRWRFGLPSLKRNKAKAEDGNPAKNKETLPTKG